MCSEINMKQTTKCANNEHLCYNNESVLFKTLDKGWSWMIMFTSFGAFFLIGVNMYGVGIMHAVLLERYRENVALTSWAGSLQTAFMSLGAPLSSFVVDRFSCRTAVMLSGVLFAAGYLGTAFAPNIQSAIFTLGFVAGCGAGVGYTSSMVVIGFNFKQKRHLALGFVLSGMGAGLFALAPLMQVARDYYGSTGFFITQAAMALNIITFGATFFPSRLELHTQEMRRNCEVECQENKTKSKNVFKQYFKALLNKPIIFLSVGMFLNCFGSHIIYLHLPIYVVSKEFSQMQASFIVSLAGILAVVGRLITGFVANLNIVQDIWLYSGSLGLVAVGTIVYPHISSILAGHIIYSVIFGLFFGSCYVLMTSVNIQFVGINFVSAAIGVELFFGGIGAVSGPILAGLLVDIGGTYEQSITCAGISIFLAALLSALTICFKAPFKDGGVISIEEVIPKSINESEPLVSGNGPKDMTAL